MNQQNTGKRWLGCIADDFTGAGDAASFLADQGLRTLLLIWPVTEAIDPTEYDAVVIALKSRSEEKTLAVRESLAAVNWLRDKGAQKIYIKYCSTFDSTPEGNIGPVCDAVMEAMDQPYTILCPSLPKNGRTVEHGVLYVNGVPLARSHMKNHPLNPMWCSEIPELMRPQSAYPVLVISREEMVDAAKTAARIEEWKTRYSHFYLVPDYTDADDGQRITALFADLPLWTGGSELLSHYAEMARSESNRLSSCQAETSTMSASNQEIGRVMICGSCSDMTQKQVRAWIDAGGRGCMVSEEDVAAGEPRIREMASLYLKNPSEDCLFYSSGSVGLRAADSSAALSGSIEAFMAGLAAYIKENGPTERWIAAGGETSGAVTLALGFRAFRIGRSIAPGVPILMPTERKGMQLVLKSGNFGAEDFFLTTLV